MPIRTIQFEADELPGPVHFFSHVDAQCNTEVSSTAIRRHSVRSSLEEACALALFGIRVGFPVDLALLHPLSCSSPPPMVSHDPQKSLLNTPPQHDSGALLSRPRRLKASGRGSRKVDVFLASLRDSKALFARGATRLKGGRSPTWTFCPRRISSHHERATFPRRSESVSQEASCRARHEPLRCIPFEGRGGV